jgi:hypothetical protein
LRKTPPTFLFSALETLSSLVEEKNLNHTLLLLLHAELLHLSLRITPWENSNLYPLACGVITPSAKLITNAIRQQVYSTTEPKG